MGIEQDLRKLAGALSERTFELAHAMPERLVADVPEYYRGADPALLDVGGRSIMASINDIFNGLGHGRSVPESATGPAIEEARLAARAGVDVHDLLRTYRIGHGVTWQAIIEVAHAVIDDDERRVDVLKLTARYLFDWNNRVAEVLVATYERERDSMFRDRESRKRDLIRDLLHGLPVDTDELVYPVHGGHLGVVAWGASPEEAFRRLAAVVGGPTLTTTGLAGAVFGWIGGDTALDLASPIARQFEPPPETRIALGKPAAGTEGFRSTHQQALEAYAVARVQGNPVTWYRDVALEALLIRDLVPTRKYVEHVLGPIAGDNTRDAALRKTLAAYFATGQNAAAAAHLVGVHERTIAYRLRSIEQRLGQPIATQREELAVALRLHELLRVDGARASDGAPGDGSPSENGAASGS